ncbi:MAG: hypothetical protein LBP56_06715 [Odoribacteraceae bacterium]|nr:hypothetical protein [Odoribacteraceae bacterium]
MKKHFSMMVFVSLFTAVALCSCGKDDDDGPSGAFDGAVVVAVQNGSSYSSKVDSVKVLIVTGENYDQETGSYSWAGPTVAKAAYNGGNFTFQLPATVSSTYLDVLFDNPPAGVSISDSKVKTAIARVLAYKEGEQVGEFYYSTGEWTTIFVYVNGDLSVTGTATDDTGDGGQYTSKFNAHLKQGWNKLYVQADENKEEQTTKTPAGTLKWIAHVE